MHTVINWPAFADKIEQLALLQLTIAQTFPCPCPFVHVEPMFMAEDMLTDRGTIPVLRTLN
jgi:hypothetical protein